MRIWYWWVVMIAFVWFAYVVFTGIVVNWGLFDPAQSATVLALVRETRIQESNWKAGRNTSIGVQYEFVVPGEPTVYSYAEFNFFGPPKQNVWVTLREGVFERELRTDPFLEVVYLKSNPWVNLPRNHLGDRLTLLAGGGLLAALANLIWLAIPLVAVYRRARLAYRQRLIARYAHLRTAPPGPVTYQPGVFDNDDPA